ncbi:L-sorbose 1-dehydrogenase [Rhypophila decipiens]
MDSTTIGDIVIIGGGTAGLVLASRLSENESLHIIVIEAGDDHRADPQVLTPGMWPLLTNSSSNWAFKTTPQGFLDNSVDFIPQGRLLGGSSGINSFLFTPTSQASVDAWAKLGNKGWDFETFTRAANKSYTLYSPSGKEEATGNGPIQLQVAAPHSEPEATWTTAFIESLATLGFASPQDPFSGRVCGGFSNPESVDPSTGQRSFSANTYLGAAESRPNLTVITGATVTKILLSTSRPDGVVAEGVQFTESNGKIKKIRARREVILYAGTLNSPRLLELSGIGNPDILKRLGIKVVLDNPHVGETLQNHVYTGVTFEVADNAIETLDPFFRNDPQAVGAAMQAYGVNRTGPLGSSSIVASAQLPFPGIQTEQGKTEVNQLLQDHHLDKSADDSKQHSTSSEFAAAHAAFVKCILLSPAEASANYVFGPAYTEFEDRANPTFRAPGNHITIAAMLSHPLSRGYVHIATATSADESTENHGLVINPRYLSHPRDVKVLARHIWFIEQSISRAEPLAKLLKPRASKFADLAAVKEYLRKTAKGSHHYTGTCSMMPKTIGGVVDHELRVYGTLNLRVCDASVLPITPRANTQAVVYGVAEMGSGLIQESLWPGCKE